MKRTKQELPILVRHAVSLSIAFALALVLSFFVGHFIHQQLQLGKLNSQDQARFEQGVGYVVTHAGTNQQVTDDALDAVRNLANAQRAADLLLAVAISHASREDVDEPTIPDSVIDAIAPLMRKLEPTQAIGLYDNLVQIEGINPITTAQNLLNSLKPEDDAELLLVVDLLDTRLLWSKWWVPQDLWIRWLSALTKSDSELTQAQTAKRLGELPDAMNDPRVSAALAALSQSKHETVRNTALKAIAGYALLAKDPTEYEQMLFQLGEDANPIIARRAWLVVGHVNPLSGFAVNWRDAEPGVAKAILWSAAMTSPETPTAVWQAYDNAATRALSLQALAILDDSESKQRLDNAIDRPTAEAIDMDPDRVIAFLSNAEVPSDVMAFACVSLRSSGRDTAELIDRLVRMSQPKPRLLGALLAAMKGAKPTLITGDFETLLKRSPDVSVDALHAMTDDELAAMGLSRVDALSALLDAAASAPPSANRSVEAKLMQLAMWVRGDLGDDFTPRAEAMLLDDELPTATVLMCLLHKQRPIALDYLLGDLVTPQPNLHELFVQQRYWHVFRQFVDTSDMTLWLWGDPEAQAFQLEAMRQWYAVNRWRIADGWWPVVIDD